MYGKINHALFTFFFKRLKYIFKKKNTWYTCHCFFFKNYCYFVSRYHIDR